MTYGISIYKKNEKKRVKIHDTPGKMTTYKTKAEAKHDIKKYFTTKPVKEQYSNPRVFKIK